MIAGPSQRWSMRRRALFFSFGSRRIGQLFANLRYDPDTIPKQQVSLAFLLLLVLAVSLILGVIRTFTFGSL